MVLAVPFELNERRIELLRRVSEKEYVLLCTKTPYGDVWQVRFPDGSLSSLFRHFEDAWNLMIRFYSKKEVVKK